MNLSKLANKYESKCVKFFFAFESYCCFILYYFLNENNIFTSQKICQNICQNICTICEHTYLHPKYNEYSLYPVLYK